MRGEVRKVSGVAHSLAWLTRLSNTLGLDCLIILLYGLTLFSTHRYHRSILCFTSW
jgi:hypothetical protein